MPVEDSQNLGETLGPALIAHCGGRLGPIEWFRTSHQHGGAATGFSTWRAEGGEAIPVLVKLPVGPVEHRWTVALGRTPLEEWGAPASAACPLVRVIESGTSLAGYDFAWLVLERLVGPPLSAHVDAAGLHELLASAAEFQERAIRHAPVEGRPRVPEWERLLDRSREVARKGIIAESHRWGDAVRKVQKALPRLVATWEGRSINAWCHGDMHPGNALRRAAHGGVGRCVLVDLALVHPGHWVEDALYLERQFWAHPEVMAGVKPVSELARHRRERGLPADGNYADLANVRRVLMAASAPGVMDREGSPRYLHAALEVIERVLPQVVH